MNIFFQHPKDVCMTYFSHFWFSLSLSLKLAKGSIKAFLHAIYPDRFITSTSDITKEIMQDIESSGCKQD
tara:strand:+ start:1742 stop:1951 length:210 start_codon:yes stop_codon:yes gene_type:complete